MPQYALFNRDGDQFGTIHAATKKAAQIKARLQYGPGIKVYLNSRLIVGGIGPSRTGPLKSNPVARVPVNKWLRAKVNRNGTITLAVPNPQRKPNVEGFRDSRGVFHPIRSADDYDPESVGETGKDEFGYAKKRRRRR